MDLPLGTAYIEHIKIAERDCIKLIFELMDKGFTGYLIVMIDGYDGFEEGAILFKKGQPVGAAYEYMKHGILIKGNDALEMVLNALKAKYGIADVYALTPQHMELVTAFHEKMLFTIKVDKKLISKLTPKEFTDKYAKKVIEHKEEQSKYELFKRFGLPVHI